ncbi:uncharacterized protein An02g02430 [Aspergillus niger]|uniref:Contig An02c0060, genomic contig n=2 Tax=Aspergillus niger TaxID=5061 RepID=A2QC64_ASPNC|nr:uncharacterized protein An02g02430 [Aspergillus niger]CAK37524.1 unnamed protein product [Aspergillus niger]
MDHCSPPDVAGWAEYVSKGLDSTRMGIAYVLLPFQLLHEHMVLKAGIPSSWNQMESWTQNIIAFKSAGSGRSQGVNSELQGLGRAGSRYRRPGFNQGGGLAPESDQ